MRLFYRGNSGSVSVYFIITLAALFLFNAVLIDFARIKIAEQLTENALRAAVRSTLSQYDKDLHTYGLFALADKVKGEETLRSVLQQHTSINRSEHTFRLINPEWNEDSIELQFHYSLADHEVFVQQVYEEMKFKAPIEFSLEVWDKFQKSGTASSLQETSQFTAAAKQLDDLIMKRERSLDRAWNEAENLIGLQGQIASVFHQYEDRLSKMNDLIIQISELEAEIIEEETKNEDESSTEEEENSTEKTLVEVTAELASLQKTMEASMQNDYDSFLQAQEKIRGHLKAAKDYNEQLIKKMDDSEKATSSKTGSFKEVRQDLKEQIGVLKRDYFETYELGIASSIGLFSGFKAKVELPDQYEALLQENEVYYNQSVKFYQQQRSLEMSRKSRNQKLESMKSEQIHSISKQLQQVKDLVSACNGDESQIYNELRKIKDTQAAQEPPIEIDLDNAEGIGNQSMSLVDRLGNSMLHIRDKVYLNEYALSEFSYRTGPNDHPLSNQEAEYILYGLSSCVLNHGAAYTEMFALRLAIRTMEAMLKPGAKLVGAASPLLFILKAVAEGAIKAYADMKKLVDGLEVEISAKLSKKVTMNYKDYMRVFMLMHSNEHHVVDRMQALIELTTGEALANKAAYIQAKATLSIQLWFIPGVMKLLDYEVKGRRVEISKTIVLAY